MKNKTTNTQTRSLLAPSNKGASNVTNPHRKYEAILEFTVCCRTRVIVEAANLKGAIYQASEIEADEVHDWNPVNGNVSVVSVRPTKADNGKAAND